MKKVLLIGDSIRLGYCGYVKELLDGKAELYWPTENCEFAQYVYVHLSWWRSLAGDPADVDLVHWNCGHWDVSHWRGADRPLNSPELYADMLERIVVQMRKIFPKAKIVFATTTPMNPDGSQSENVRTTEDIARYNEVARSVMKRLDVPVNDLFSVIKAADPAVFHDAAHFNEAGYKLLAAKVSGVISELLGV